MPTAAEQAVLILANALEPWGIILDPIQQSQFETYAAMLVEWNATRMNLTRLTSPEQIGILHFLDSLALTQILSVPRSAALLDIGTGAGFPGLPLKIIRPDLKLTLMEATAKKLTFCRAVADALGFDDLETTHARAEERIGQEAHPRYDVVTARAVAPMAKLLGWAAPYLRDDRSTFVAWKGTRAADEIHDAQAVARALNVTMQLKTVPMPPVNGEATEHHYVVCRKSAR